MLPAAALAAACAAWHPAVVGYYPGTVQSDGEKPIDTWITETPDGRLTGHYILHEPTREVEGTLEAVGDQGCETAVFRWTDIYGSGLAQLHFYPERRCFEGGWGRLTIVPSLTWRACTQERVTS